MRGATLYFGILGATGLLFLLFPGLDLMVSGWFHTPPHGFAGDDVRALDLFIGTIPVIVRLITALVVVGTLWLVLTGRPLWRLDRKALAFIALSTALGPGLIVNAVLKDHWGRARPYQVEAFGGPRTFTPAPLPADQCQRNCSFVSGHAALGFSLVAFAFLIPAPRQRRIATGAALGFGAAIGLARIAVGHHFLSDIVYAGLIVYAATWFLHWWVVTRDGLASVTAMRLYRTAGAGISAAAAATVRLAESERGRLALWLAAVAVIEAVSIRWIDRPLALYLRAHAEPMQPFFELVGRLGLGYPYAILFGLSYAALRWGGAFPRLRPHADTLRAAAPVPAFLFAAVVTSGLTVDILKVIFGRPRPRMLFGVGDYGFDWFGGNSDFWSFPSGHAATAAAVVAALWWLWPRHVLFYILVGGMIAASRVITCVHYLSDTVMGAAVAVVITRVLAGMMLRDWPGLASLRLRSIVERDAGGAV